MKTIISVYFFILGLTFGSFFNVVGLRVPVKKSIVAPRSACPHCGHQLTWGELIPVLSYIIQKGKCRSCRAPISPLYPIMEFLTGILFMTAPLIVGWNGELVIALTLISLFIIITVSDLNYMIIPDKVLLVFAAIFLCERMFLPLSPWWDSIVGALIGFTILFLIALLSKGGMGGGDIKLYALLGFVLGWKTVLLSIFFSSFCGAIFGIIGILLKKVERGKPIPFGPFIGLGTMIAYYYGDAIFNFYLSLF